MDMPKLYSVSLSIQNIYDCRLFLYLLKIIKNVDSFMISIDNPKTKVIKLNDKCL